MAVATAWMRYLSFAWAVDSGVGMTQKYEEERGEMTGQKWS